MIKQLIFIRHGQSEANAAGVYAGQRAEIQLTKLGRKQAVEAGEQLKNVKISHIFASDLDRAHRTAEIIAETIGYSERDIVTDPRLREINVGKLTGTPDHGFANYLLYAASGVDDKAETPEDVELRVKSFLNSLVAYDGDTVLIVAHAGLGRVLRAILTGVSVESLATLDIVNAKPCYLPVVHLEKELV